MAIGAALSILLVALLVAGGGSHPAAAATAIIGDGSSFAGIELQQWQNDVGRAPYNLNVNYQSNSSGQGRQDFANHVVDFAVSDIRYVGQPYDVNPPPASSFEYVPVTAGGVAIMYNLQKEGFTQSAKALQLSPLTVCGIFTGAIKYWDDDALKADNPGVTLPHVQLRPVVRQDPAGTNYVMEEYCIAEEPALYAQFVTSATQINGTGYPDAPTSTWPIINPIIGATTSDGVADAVAATNDDGYVTMVETGYADQRHFPVAAVKNDTGAYVLPTDVAVASALSFATQQPDGTHVLNFRPGDAKAYNPSTYSYLLMPLTGIAASKGAALTQFAEYCLTIGQQEASRLGYASIGRALIQFGLQRVQQVPGYVAPTSAELAAIPGQSTGTSGATTTTAATSGTSATTATTAAASLHTTVTTTGAATSGATTRVASSTGGGSAPFSSGALSAAAGGTVDASATLDPTATGPLSHTGIESDVVLGVGIALVAMGEVGRRRYRRSRSIRLS